MRGINDDKRYVLLVEVRSKREVYLMSTRTPLQIYQCQDTSHIDIPIQQVNIIC